MKLYRICTENLNYNDILDYLDEHFPDGYTVIHANGAWQGQREKSLVIEITRPTAGSDVEIGHLAYWLKKHNNQQAVMLQIVGVNVQIL